MATIWDVPQFIVDALTTGPYGYEQSLKIAEINKNYEKYYDGADFELDYTEDEEPTIIQSKNIKKLIDKQASFMFGKTPVLKLSCNDDNGCKNLSAMQSYLDNVLQKNHFSSKIIKGAKDCFIGGRVFVKLNITAEKLSLTFIPADSFVYETEPDDVDVLKSVILWYCVTDTEDKSEQRWWRQRYVMNEGKCYVDENLFDGYGNTIEGYEKPYSNTGLNRIPGYVIVNDGLTGDMQGESDVELLQYEDSFYNDMRSRNGDTLKKNMNPMAYVMGASPKTFNGLDRKPGAVNDIQPDPVLNGTLPNVGQLESNFGFASAFEDTLKHSKENMYQVLGVPDVSSAATSGLVTSGKGLKCLYWDLITRCDGKWTAWKPALEYIGNLIMDAAKLCPNLKTIYGDFNDEDYIVTIESQYALPDDEDAEREGDIKEVTAGTRSIKSYLMKWGGADARGMTSEQADSELEQIAKEKQMMQASFDLNEFSTL